MSNNKPSNFPVKKKYTLTIVISENILYLGRSGGPMLSLYSTISSSLNPTEVYLLQILFCKNSLKINERQTCVVGPLRNSCIIFYSIYSNGRNVICLFNGGDFGGKLGWEWRSRVKNSFCLHRTRLKVKWRLLVVTFSIEEFSGISQIKRFFYFNAVN